MSLAVYSDIMIAVRADIYMKCILLQNILAVLAQGAVHQYANTAYLGKVSILWHTESGDAADILKWIEWLEDEVENPPVPVERYRDHNNAPVFEDKMAFGAILLSENGSTQEWGDPLEFELGVAHVIKTPY